MPARINVSTVALPEYAFVAWTRSYAHIVVGRGPNGHRDPAGTAYAACGLHIVGDAEIAEQKVCARCYRAVNRYDALDQQARTLAEGGKGL
jgi:hypothetical protein